MPFEVRYRHGDDHVLVVFTGTPTLSEFLSVLQEVGADSVAWPGSLVAVDLRGVTTPYSFTEQLQIGEAVARNFAHLRRIAAIVPPERVTRVGERAANRLGATTCVFSEEQDALDWLRQD